MQKPKDQSAKPTWRKPHYYGWTLLNILAACAALLGWVLCLYIFGNPEIPRNYRILQKFGRAEPPQGFALQKAPEGEAADPKGLYRRYAGMNVNLMRNLNRSLMRNYVSQLREHGLIQYVEGDFKIDSVRNLREGEVIYPGVAILAHAMVKPDEFSEAAPWPVSVEYLIPTDDTNAASHFNKGDMLQLAKVPHCPSMLRVTHHMVDETPHVILTVVPIAMGNYMRDEEVLFQISPPRTLNPGASFPIFTDSDEEA